MNEALEDLMWRFQSAEADLGFRGQNINPDGGGGGVYDDEASWNQHASLCSPKMFACHARWRRVDVALAQLAPEHLQRIRLVFIPFGAAKTDYFALNACDWNHISIIGLVIHLVREATGHPYTKALRWFEDQAKRQSSTNKAAEYIEKARVLADESVAAYDLVRRAQMKKKRGELDSWLEASERL